MSGDGGTWEKARVRIAAVALVAVLVPLALAGAGREQRRLRALGLGERIDLLREDEEARIRRALGRGYPLYRAISRHVPLRDAPPQALVALRAPVDRETFLARLHLESLIFPRRIAWFHAVSGLLAGGADPARPDPGVPFFVLDLEPDRGPPDPGRFVAVERGPRHVLWRLRR